MQTGDLGAYCLQKFTPTTGSWIAIGVFGVLLTFVIIGTSVDLFHRSRLYAYITRHRHEDDIEEEDSSIHNSDGGSANNSEDDEEDDMNYFANRDEQLSQQEQEDRVVDFLNSDNFQYRPNSVLRRGDDEDSEDGDKSKNSKKNKKQSSSLEQKVRRFKRDPRTGQQYLGFVFTSTKTPTSNSSIDPADDTSGLHQRIINSTFNYDTYGTNNYRIQNSRRSPNDLVDSVNVTEFNYRPNRSSFRARSNSASSTERSEEREDDEYEEGNNKNGEAGCFRILKRLALRLCLSWSLMVNLEILLAKPKGPPKLRFLHALRVLSMLWIILGNPSNSTLSTL
jgi:hypothetical protein